MSKFFTRVLPKSLGGLAIIASQICSAQSIGGSSPTQSNASQLVPYTEMAIIPTGVKPVVAQATATQANVAVPQRLPVPATAQERFQAQQTAAAEKFAAQQKFAAEQFNRMQQQMTQQQYGASAVQPAVATSVAATGTVAPGNFVQQSAAPQVQQAQHTIGTVGRKLSQYVNQVAVAPPVRPADVGEDVAAQAVKKATEAVKKVAQDAATTATSTTQNATEPAKTEADGDTTASAAENSNGHTSDGAASEGAPSGEAANCSAGCSAGYPGYQAMPVQQTAAPAGTATTAGCSAPMGYAMVPIQGYQMPTCQMPGCTVEGCQMPGHLMPWLRNGILGRGQLAQPMVAPAGLMLGQGQMLQRPLVPMFNTGCTTQSCMLGRHNWKPNIGFPELSFPTITIPGFTIPGINLCGNGCSTPGCSTGVCAGDEGCSSESGGCSGGGCGDGSPWNFGGWFQQGYHENSNGLFNNRPGKWNQHQLWFYAEREARPTNGMWDWGFRFDIMYGIDAQDTQAFGNSPGAWDFQNGFDFGSFGWALPQLYVELANEDVSVIFGHFFTAVGYEVVTAPDNFFYSHAYTMYNSEPFTHTGVLATINASDDTTVYAGWTLGWDSGFDQFEGGSNFLGGISHAVSDELTVTYITTFGDFGARGNDGYGHSIVADYAFADDWNYVLQSDLVTVTPNGGGRDHDVGLNQYLFYTINDHFKVGGRVEWWHDDGESTYEATVGLNYRPNSHMIFRPELRQDWSPANGVDFSTFAFDSIFVY